MPSNGTSRAPWRVQACQSDAEIPIRGHSVRLAVYDVGNGTASSGRTASSPATESWSGKSVMPAAGAELDTFEDGRGAEAASQKNWGRLDGP
jgi:hypothetical protein